MKTITLTETKQPCYDVRVRFIGIRKRARKQERHSLKLIESVDIDALIDSTTGEIRTEALNELKALAVKEIGEGYRTYESTYRLEFSYVTRGKDSGFISTTYEPFGDGHFAISCEVE